MSRFNIGMNGNIVFKRYINLGDDPDINTGYSVNEWSCAIAGYNTKSGAKPDELYAYKHADGHWHVRGSDTTAVEAWDAIDIMLVHNSIAHNEGY